MAKKIVAVFSVSPSVLALRELESGLRQHTPKDDRWRELAAGARALLREATQRNRDLLRLAPGLRGQRGLRLRVVPTSNPLSLRRFDLAIDLPTLLAWRGAREALERLLAFLGALGQGGTWQAEIRIGRAPPTASLRDLGRELLARAAGADVELPTPAWVRRSAAARSPAADPAPAPPARPAPAPSESLHAGPARPRRKAPAPAPAAPPPPADEPPPPPPAGKKKRPRAAGGSFGGLPDDEIGAPPPAGGPELSQEAEFFLSYGRLTWPCTEAELRAVHRQVVKTQHPDRHPGDAGATHRFMLLQRGYEALRARLAG